MPVTSNGQQYTTYVEVTTVIAPGTVVTKHADPTSAKKGTNVGAIVGGVVGGIGGLLLLILLLWFLLRRRRKAQLDEHFDGNFDPDRVAAASTGVNHHASPPHSGALTHNKRNSSILEGGIDNAGTNMSQVGLVVGGVAGGAYPAAPYPASTTTSSIYPPTSSASPPPQSHHLPAMSLSSQGHNGSYAPYGAAGGPYQDMGGMSSNSNVPLGPAAYYGRNEKQVLSPPGEQPQQPSGAGGYYPGGFGMQHQQQQPGTPTTMSSGYYNPYVGRAMSPETAPSEVSSSAAGLAYNHTGTNPSVAQSAKEREARAKAGGAHVMNPTEEEEGTSGRANRGSVVQHRDGGRLEEEGEAPSEIPPSYDSIAH
ncbi:hypothetical protein D9611_012437 [Ephemerocybe angulata]|uniref:Uncharacterized protein n=1 Tax=Ephemerocybe angulata TaxID=980116 RepID=A0A8H5FKR9_9AGAR|nr:hypothetical protein D9611_012437 [Tulosesus angulatus]